MARSLSLAIEPEKTMPNDRILLVDPFKNLLNAYRMILEEEGFLVQTASHLAGADELFRKSQYAVIITEYIPPVEAIEDMVRWLKNNSPETYIIIVTNTIVDENTYKRLFAAGVDDFILKPYSPEKILVHIKKGLKHKDLIDKIHELESLALLEPITQKIQGPIFKPIFFRKCLRQEIKKARRHHRSFSLLLMQMPDKKEVGDRYDGFYTGLLRILKRYTREEDMVGKNDAGIGIILPETDEIGSKALVQRLLNLIHAHSEFRSDDFLTAYIRTLSFQSFTYPDRFAVPDHLRTVLEELEKERLQQ